MPDTASSPHVEESGQTEEVAKGISELTENNGSEEWQPPQSSLHSFVGLTTIAQFEELEAFINRRPESDFFPVNGADEVWYDSTTGTYWRINDLHNCGVNEDGQLEYLASWSEAQYTNNGTPVWTPLPDDCRIWVERRDLQSERLKELATEIDEILRRADEMDDETRFSNSDSDLSENE